MPNGSTSMRSDSVIMAIAALELCIMQEDQVNTSLLQAIANVSSNSAASLQSLWKIPIGPPQVYSCQVQCKSLNV